MSIILKNGLFIDWQDLTMKASHIRVEKGANLEFFTEDEKCTGEVIDCTGKMVTKSFACGHHHAYSLLARGMPDLGLPLSNFKDILMNLWWKLDIELDAEMIRASALGTALSCAMNGVTFVIDHHASPHLSKNVLSIIQQAFNEVGVNQLLCLEISDRNGDKWRDQAIEETENFLAKQPGLIGLHASFTLSDDTLNWAQILSQKNQIGIHIHAAEDLIDQSITQQITQRSVVERLSEFGFLDNSQTILAHALHLNQMERETLKRSKAYVVVNTESNLNNRVGHFSSSGLKADRIFLGTDGMHSDMIRSAQTHFFDNNYTEKGSMQQVYQRLRNVHNYLSENSFAGDGEDNLIIIDYPTPTTITSENVLNHIFYGFESKYIESVICEGEFIVKNRTPVKVSADEILQFCRHQGDRLWKKLSK